MTLATLLEGAATPSPDRAARDFGRRDARKKIERSTYLRVVICRLYAVPSTRVPRSSRGKKCSLRQVSKVHIQHMPRRAARRAARAAGRLALLALRLWSHMRGRARIHDRMGGRASPARPQPARPPRTPAHAWSSWREIGPAFPCSGRPSHCKALTSAAAPSRCARSACPVNPSFTLNTTTPAQQIFCSARPLGCVSATQCRSERPTALLLLAPEDN